MPAQDEYSFLALTMESQNCASTDFTLDSIFFDVLVKPLGKSLGTRHAILILFGMLPNCKPRMRETPRKDCANKVIGLPNDGQRLAVYLPVRLGLFQSDYTIHLLLRLEGQKGNLLRSEMIYDGDAAVPTV